MDEIDQMMIPARDILSLVLNGPLPDKWSVYCETIHDENLRDNRLPLVSDLLSELARSLMLVSRWKNDHRASASECGTYAYNCLEAFASDFLEYIDPEDATRICKQWLELMGEEDA